MNLKKLHNLNLNTIVGIAGILFVISIIVSVVILEQQPQYKDRVVDSGVVVQSGCVTGWYKSYKTYDCSTELLMEKEGRVRVILDVGVLPDDPIDKYCGKRLNMKYRCIYSRARK